MINDKKEIEDKYKFTEISENWSELSFEDRLNLIIHKANVELKNDQ